MTSQSGSPAHLVGIGASAGGLEPLEEFFKNLPANTGAAYVVVQHLSPDFKSMMDEILARFTSLPIKRVTDGLEVFPDQIYLIPPKKEMVISEGKLRLSERSSGAAPSMPIDIFFRSMADDYGPNCVAVVLSGSGSDGSRGLENVHSAGGLVISQSKESARFDSMPASAQATGFVDHILAPGDMPEAVVRYFDTGKDAPERIDPDDQDGLQRIFSLLREGQGVDFSAYKPNTIMRRIDRRMRLLEFKTVQDYAEYMEEDSSELESLYMDLLIGVTAFMRDPEAFEFLRDSVVPKVFENKQRKDQVRCWIAGCATGEEAYTMAILLYDEALRRQCELKVFATDVHRSSLAVAAEGIYDEERLKNLPEALRQEWFIPLDDGQFQVKSDLRKTVVFAQHDLLKDPPFTKIDLLSCRNLLIYFKPATQMRVLSLMHFALNPEGKLFLGPSESLGEAAQAFRTLERHWRIYEKIPGAQLPQPLRFPLASGVGGLRVGGAKAVPRGGRSMDPELVDVYDTLLSRHIPPSILCTSDRKIVHLFGDSKEFLALTEGRFSSDLLDLVDGELHMALSSAFQRVEKTNKPITFNGIHVEREGEERTLDIVVEPVGEGRERLSHVLVSLSGEREPTTPATEASLEASEISRERIADLEAENKNLRENLQSTVEELETSNEELQAANEELLASNEELQSTNEELHSVNEELYTVNSEYERKIKELTNLTNDLDNLLRSLDIGIIYLNRECRIRKYNNAATRVFNLLPQDVGRPLDHISNSLGSTMVNEGLCRVLDEGKVWEQEVQTSHDDWYLLRLVPYYNEISVLEGVILAMVDINQMKASEKQARLLAAVVHDSNDAVTVQDIDGNILEWNAGARKLYGYDGNEAREMSIWSIIPDEKQGEARRLLKALKGGEEFSGFETRRVRKDGEVLEIWLTATPLRGNDGNIFAFATTERNVTEDNRRRRALRQARDEAQAGSTAKNEFLASMSHEIRTPLNGVIGMMELAREESDTQQQGEYLDIALKSSEQLLNLINDILDFSKIESGRLDIAERVFSIDKVVSSVASSFQPVAEDKNLELTAHVDEELPEKVTGDNMRLTQLLNNLVDNAVKYTLQGAVSLEATLVSKGRRGVDVRFTVTDSGVGISAELASQLFEPFHQGSRVADTPIQGVGLGLSIVKRLTEAMGGSISVRAAEEQGSVFELQLPFGTANGADTSTGAEGPCTGLKMLLVDDDAVGRQVLRRIIMRQGGECVEARNGKEALDRIREELPDVIFMDIQMPGMDGLEATSAIRNGEAGEDARDLPIVAVTAYAMKGDRERFLEAGMSHYLDKPVKREKVLEVMAPILQDLRRN